MPADIRRIGYPSDTKRTTYAGCPISSVVDVIDTARRPSPVSSKKRPAAVPLGLMRVIVTVLAAAAFAQPVLAGQFLAGAFDMVAVHGAIAVLIELLSLVQIVCAVLLWRPGRGPGWPVFVSLGVTLIVIAQSVLGYTRVLAVHVPLGVAFFALMSLLLIWVWRPRLGAPRADATQAHTTP